MPVPKLCTQTRSNTGSQAQRRTQTVDRNDRTPEQHMADVAACTLGRLADLSEGLDHLQRQLEMLAGWAADHPDVDYKSRSSSSATTLRGLASSAVSLKRLLP
jgi:hypothetical protein